MMTEMRFPKAERAMKKFRALEEELAPKTAAKKREAARVDEFLRSDLGTAAK